MPDVHELVAARADRPYAIATVGKVSDDPDATCAGWAHAPARPTVQGPVVGRSLLYPPGGDVAAAVDRAVSLL